MEIAEQVDRFAAAGQFAIGFLSQKERLAIARYELVLAELVNQYGELSSGDPLSQWMIVTAKDEIPKAEAALKKKTAMQLKIMAAGNG